MRILTIGLLQPTKKIIFQDFVRKNPMDISNIYKREEFRHKSMISDVVTGIICGLGTNGYILAINAMHDLLKNGNR